ncbi:MAG TPA: hypothetical protein VF152_03530 [Acidimicrobiia bacterium]
MSIEAEDRLAAPAGVPRPPWYAQRVTMILAAVAAGIGVILIVVGAVTFMGASSTRDDADDLQAQAETVESQADATRDAAATLPELTSDLNRRTDDLMASADAQVVLFNNFLACLDAAPRVVPDPAVSACFDQHLGPIEAGLEAQVAAVEELGVGLAEAEDAVEEAGRD